MSEVIGIGEYELGIYRGMTKLKGDVEEKVGFNIQTFGKISTNTHVRLFFLHVC